MSKSIIIIID